MRTLTKARTVVGGEVAEVFVNMSESPLDG